MKLYSPSTAIALLGVCLVTSQSLCAGIVIDDFETGDISLSKVDNEAVEESQAGLDPSRVIGGRRNIRFGEFGGVLQNLDISSGKFTFQVGETSRGYFSLTYGSSESPLNLDLLADGSNAFLIDFEIVSFLPGWFRLETEGDSRSASLLSLDLLQLPNGIKRFVIPFDTFDGIDLREIDQITLDVIRLNASSQTTILSIATTTIPEPSTAMMIGCISFALLSRRRVH